MEECPICCNEYEPKSSLWVELTCSHKLCTSCHSKIQTTRTTMSGETHTFSKCPFCQALTGIEIGTCPDGRMTVREHRSRCAGFEGVGTIQINYSVQGQYSLNRTAFLPNNAEGQRVLNLLRTAWDRRLCFAIGTSVTTGARNVPVWNVHHKTAMFGGVSCHGYPDPRYFERVTNELKSFGVE